MLQNLYRTAGDPIPLIWYFKNDVFETLAIHPSDSSANVIGQICMINFKTSGSMFLYQNDKSIINYKSINEILNSIESPFKRYIVLTISTGQNLHNKSLLIKTPKDNNFELIENLSKSLFSDINGIEFDFSSSTALLNVDKYIEIEISLPKAIILADTSKENPNESAVQNSIRMLSYTLFGALSCR